jgi:hypothetical protein
MSAPVLATALNSNGILRNAYPVGSVINITDRHPTSLIQKAGQEWLKEGYMVAWDASYESFLKTTLFTASDITKDITNYTPSTGSSYNYGPIFIEGGTKFLLMSNRPYSRYFIYSITNPNDISTASYDGTYLELEDTIVNNAESRICFFGTDGYAIYHGQNEDLRVLDTASATITSWADEGVVVNIGTEFGVPSITDINTVEKPNGSRFLYVVSGSSVYTFAVHSISSNELKISLLNTSTLEMGGGSVFVNSDGTKGYILTSYPEYIYEYSIVGEDWIYSGNSIDLDVAPSAKLCPSPDGTKLYATSSADTTNISQFSTNASDYILNDTSLGGDGISTYMRIK